MTLLLITVGLSLFVVGIGGSICVRRGLSRLGVGFFAGVSRRLHAPLALVRKPVRRLERGRGLSRGKVRCISLVRGGAGRVLRLIGRVLSFHGVRGNGVHLRISLFGLGRVMSSFRGRFEIVTRRGRIDFAFRLTNRSVVM